MADPTLVYHLRDENDGLYRELEDYRSLVVDLKKQIAVSQPGTYSSPPGRHPGSSPSRRPGPTPVPVPLPSPDPSSASSLSARQRVVPTVVASANTGDKPSRRKKDGPHVTVEHDALEMMAKRAELRDAMDAESAELERIAARRAQLRENVDAERAELETIAARRADLLEQVAAEHAELDRVRRQQHAALGAGPPAAVTSATPLPASHAQPASKPSKPTAAKCKPKTASACGVDTPSTVTLPSAPNRTAATAPPAAGAAAAVVPRMGLDLDVCEEATADQVDEVDEVELLDHGSIDFRMHTVDSAAEFVRVKIDASKQGLAQHALNVWELPKPTIVLRVSGSTKDAKGEDVKNPGSSKHVLGEQRDVVRGLVMAAGTTQAWIFCSGLDFGMSSLVGQVCMHACVHVCMYVSE